MPHTWLTHVAGQAWVLSRQCSCAGVRPVPLEIVIQSFDISNLEARMSAMARPAYTAVSNMLKAAPTPADAKSAILFVPTRKQARLTALDLLTYAAADGEAEKFLQVGPRISHPALLQAQKQPDHRKPGMCLVRAPQHGHCVDGSTPQKHDLWCSVQLEASDLEPYLTNVHDKALKHSLQYGVGFLHETMSAGEQEIVNRLFNNGAIQVRSPGKLVPPVVFSQAQTS